MYQLTGLAPWCLRAGVLGLAAAVSVTAGVTSQEIANYRARAELVRLYVSVIPEERALAAPLAADDFVVTENGAPRDITVFFGPDDTPLEVALVADMSGSMHGWNSNQLIFTLLEQLPPTACVLLLPYREAPLPGMWARANDPTLRDFIARFERVDNEATYDALVAAYQLLRARRSGDADPARLNTLMRFRAPNEHDLPIPPPTSGRCSSREAGSAVRQAVVAVTDEPVAHSEATFADVLLNAWGSGIPLFAAVRTKAPKEGSLEMLGQPASDTAFRQVEALAQHTGGLVFRYHDYSSSFERELIRIGAAVSNLYLLGFVPASRASDESDDFYTRELEVSLPGRSHEVLLTDEIVLGKARSESGALDQALRGFEQLANDDLEAAAASFQLASNLAPDLAVARYGEGLVAYQRGDLDRARGALSAAYDQAPWLPDIDAFLGTVEFGLGRLDDAWDRAIAAHYAGGNVSSLIEQLQATAPRDLDLTRPPSIPLVAVRTSRTGPLGARLIMPTVLLATFSLMEQSNAMRATWHQDAAHMFLTIRGQEEVRRGARDGVRGWLTLESNSGERVASEAFEIRDASDPESIAAALRRAFAKIEQELAARATSDGPASARSST